MLTQCKLYNCASGTLGLHLSRAPWDPYPWVSNVQHGSNAQQAGIHVGDTITQLNAFDLLGQKISVIAEQLREHWASGASYATVTIWRNQTEAVDVDEHGDADKKPQQANESQHQHGINQQSLQKFATCLQHIAQLLECPVCLEVVKPPSWQCCNGHVVCNNCRSRSVKCPVCRVPLGPRGRCLLADQLFTVLAENFPCDGVKTRKSNSNERDNCKPEYHNQAKMAAEKTAAASGAAATPNERMQQEKVTNKNTSNKTICQQQQNAAANKMKAKQIGNENERPLLQKLVKKKT